MRSYSHRFTISAICCHNQRRTSMYITSTAETAMAEPSTVNNTNDIARHTPFVALRRPSHHSFVAYAVMHDPAPRLPRISLPLTRVDKGKRRAWMSSPCSEILSFALTRIIHERSGGLWFARLNTDENAPRGSLTACTLNPITQNHLFPIHQRKSAS